MRGGIAGNLTRKAEAAESQRLEAARLRLLEASRSREAAFAFARQTAASYRRAVVNRSAPAGDAVFRLRLIASYCYLRRYLAVAEATQQAGSQPRLRPRTGFESVAQRVK